MRVSSPIVLLLALTGCATDDGVPVGGSDDLTAVEDRAYEQLFATDGPALLKGVDQLRTLRVTLDQTDITHTHVRQLLDGVPVWGSEAIVHATIEGDVTGITDDLVPNVYVNTTPAYTADEAIDLAVELYAGGWDAQTDDPMADLWVIRHEGVDHLAWRVQLSEIAFTEDDGKPVLFVDAHDGDLVWGYDDFQTATCTGTTNYYGTVSVDCYTPDASTYYLEDTGDLHAVFSWNNTTTGLYYVSTTGTTFPTSTAVYRNAVEAAYSLEATQAYYATAHGRNGIDGAGGPAAVTTHGYSYITSTTSYSTGYNNASWDSTNQWMVYGDGDGTYFGSLTTLDIAGHEMTHGVTDYEANLTYSGEPGHLNESFSDVFGAMVERSVLGESSDTWLIGEDAYTPGSAGDALRYMNNPTADGASYDYYSSSLGGVDVHYGSGVANLAFYLLSEGGTHPRGLSTTSVTAIGADDAADIWYLALTSYMTSSTNFSGARTATLSAAAALYGTSSQQYTSVGNAWTAVGVNAAGTCTTSTYTGSLTKSGRTAYAPSSSGTSSSASSQTVALTGPAAANFDLYLEKKSGRTWSTVASSTGSTSTESITYASSSGTYRVAVYSRSGTGSYSVSWCK